MKRPTERLDILRFLYEYFVAAMTSLDHAELFIRDDDSTLADQLRYDINQARGPLDESRMRLEEIIKAGWRKGR